MPNAPSFVFTLWSDRQGDAALQLRSHGEHIQVEARLCESIVPVLKDDFGNYIDANGHDAQVVVAYVLERLAEDLATGRLVLGPSSGNVELDLGRLLEHACYEEGDAP